MDQRHFQRRKWVNTAVFSVTALFTVLSVSLLFYVLGYIFVHGVAAFNWDFLTKLPKPVGERGGGIANSIVGSVKILLIACALGVPIGIFAGIYLAEYGKNKMGFLIRYTTDVLNGVPSIVVGIFAYSVVVLPMKSFSALSGGVALSVIMIPLVVRGTEEFIRLVPGSVREAALALGVPQWKVVLRVVLPSAAHGILTAVLLAISRIAGETAPLIFTSFGNYFWDDGIFKPIAALPLTIFNYAISPYDERHALAWAAAFVLLIVVLSGNIIARFLLRPGQRGQA